MKLCHVKKIERHYSSSERLLHPHLKDLIINMNTYDRGTTPMIIACQFGELDSVKQLVETWGVDLHAPANYFSPNCYGGTVKIGIVTPLFVAALHGHNQIVRYLLEKGADVSIKIQPGVYYTNNEFVGWTPLYGSISNVELNPRRPLVEQQKERSAVVRSLLEFGADAISDSFDPSNGHPM